MTETLPWLLGPNTGAWNVWEMAVRAAVIYLATWALLRFGERRSLGKNSVFDIVVGVILGSMISRAINGSAPMIPTFGAGVVIIGLHWLLAMLAYHNPRLRRIIEARPILLVRQGRVIPEGMRHGLISPDDLTEVLRVRVGTDSLECVVTARLERSGAISVEPAPKSAQVLTGVWQVTLAGRSMS